MPVEHEPRRLLAHSDVPVQLHARHPLQARQLQVDRPHPLPQLHVRGRQRGARLHAEVRPAVRAPVGHRLVAGFRRPPAPAVPAAPLRRPQLGLEPLPGRSLVGELGGQLHQGDSLSMNPAGRLAGHLPPPVSGDHVKRSQGPPPLSTIHISPTVDDTAGHIPRLISSGPYPKIARPPNPTASPLKPRSDLQHPRRPR